VRIEVLGCPIGGKSKSASTTGVSSASGASSIARSTAGDAK
jgi:hypothetical protein